MAWRSAAHFAVQWAFIALIKCVYCVSDVTNSFNFLDVCHFMTTMSPKNRSLLLIEVTKNRQNSCEVNEFDLRVCRLHGSTVKRAIIFPSDNWIFMLYGGEEWSAADGCHIDSSTTSISSCLAFFCRALSLACIFVILLSEPSTRSSMAVDRKREFVLHAAIILWLLMTSVEAIENRSIAAVTRRVQQRFFFILEV